MLFVLAQAGLEPLVRQIYITPKELGENLDGQYTKTEANDIRSMPEELASEYINEVWLILGACAVPRKARKGLMTSNFISE